MTMREIEAHAHLVVAGWGVAVFVITLVAAWF